MTKGITPVFLNAKIIGEDSSLGISLVDNPQLDVKPYTSNISLTDTGIPNNGGRYLSSLYSPSFRVQFFLLVIFLFWSHYFACESA